MTDNRLNVVVFFMIRLSVRFVVVVVVVVVVVIVVVVVKASRSAPPALGFPQYIYYIYYRHVCINTY